MRIENWTQTKVNSDGTVVGGGAVETRPNVRISQGEGCGLPGCHCSDGYWITISEGLSGGQVSGMTVYFKDKKEFDEFMKTGELVGE